MIQQNKRSLYLEYLCKAIGFLACAMPFILLLILLFAVFYKGFSRLNLDFFMHFSARSPKNAGIYSAWVGTLYLSALTALLSLPIGIGAAFFLEEYAKKNRFSYLFELNISNLAAVPSVIYGLLGLELFVRILGMGRSLLAGACTLTLLILPTIITTTREALKAVPMHYREAAWALGASQVQVCFCVVLPLALPGIVTGALLGLSRAMGETAPLIVIGAATFISYLPISVLDSFTVLPIQIFNWVSRPDPAFVENASAAIVVLLLFLLFLNGLATFLRQTFEQQRVF